MSVSSSTSTISYTGNGSTTTAYTVPFAFYDATDLKVYSVDYTGSSTLLTITTNYTVSGGGGSTGSVTTTAAIPSTSTVLIQRVVPYTQLTSFTTGDRLPANSIETALDKLTMEAQQLSRNALPDAALTTGSAPYVLGINSAGGSPAWVSQSSSGIADGSITASKLTTGHPTWDGSGNLSATSFVGPLTGAVTGNVTGNVTATTISASGTITGNVTGDLTGTASAIANGSVSTTAKIADGVVTAAKLGTNEKKQICKAWVNFDGTVGGTSALAIASTQTLTASAGGSTLTWGGTGFSVTVGFQYIFTIGGSSTIGGIDLGANGNRLTVTSASSTSIVLTLPTGVTFASAVSHTANGSNSTYRFLSTIRGVPYNISSISKTSTGQYTINFSVAMTDQNYSVSATSSFSTAGYECSAQVISTSTTNTVVYALTYTTPFYTDPNLICVQVFGN